MTTRWQPGMREISGFGGGYEDACRRMLLAGLEWFETNPDADPKFRGYEGVFGLVMEDNAEAEALSKAVCNACPGGATGAMHHAVMSHLFFIRQNGWERYVEEMSRPEDPATDAEARS